MKSFTLLLSAILIFSVNSALAYNTNKSAEKEHEEHHDEHGHEEKEKSLKISEKAKSHLKIEFTNVVGKSPWTLPRTALVQVKDRSGIYKKHGDTLEFVEIQLVKSDKEKITFTTIDLHTGDAVVVQGTQFIRIIESELNSEPAGHGH
ncbi:hypothetical protein DOM22_04815 [Bdellovibrio sp. ZAP7]|uniref:hypothetical protein n=1 Tax=Bdellovibrio sp. ZAP7 TaxID=2231053 RepID=UPI0011572C2D|nr:hypothetical protein [Bdellovibrio sp. ZAP7]QDK44526.1 hypothetical protein DOM22_04815 [Bdellovibrio sp. ZAP7]